MTRRSDDIKSALRSRKQKVALTDRDYLNTGSTVLNLACSGRIDGGYPKGVFVLTVGDSSSGKTWLALTALAEACLSPEFKDYRLIADFSENGVLYDVRDYFGDTLAKRLEPPAGTRSKPVYSSTVEEMYFHLDDAVKAGKPFIFIEDSLDALVPEDDVEHFHNAKKAHDKGKDASGSYGTAKAKLHSSFLRVVQNDLRKSGSLLIGLSQTRDNIGFGAMFNPKTRSGGKALRFYARLELWTSVKERLKKRVMGADRVAGFLMQVEVKKNHVSGWEGKIEVPFYKGYGVDDVGGCVHWLVSEGYWKETKGVITAPDLALAGTSEEIIAAIEEKGMEDVLRSVVAEVWHKIEQGSRVERKKRYV